MTTVAATAAKTSTNRPPWTHAYSLYHSCDSITIGLRYDDATTHSTTTEVVEITICVRFDCDTTTTRLRRKIVMLIFCSRLIASNRVERMQARAILWSYLAPFLRYGDLLAENCKFSLPYSHLTPSLGVNSSVFLVESSAQKLEGWGYCCTVW